MTVFAPTIALKSSLWDNLARIAIGHAREARTHRATWEAGVLRDIQPEMHASMVAVTAVSFAIDAIHAEIAPLVSRDPDPRTGRGRQWGYMLETFRRASPAARTWQTDLEWVYALRDDAVHFHGEAHEPVWHPGLKTNIARENLAYSVESSERAVDFLVATLSAILLPDPQRPPELAAWGQARAHVLVELDALRSSIQHRSTEGE